MAQPYTNLCIVPIDHMTLILTTAEQVNHTSTALLVHCPSIAGSAAVKQFSHVESQFCDCFVNFFNKQG